MENLDKLFSKGWSVSMMKVKKIEESSHKIVKSPLLILLSIVIITILYTFQIISHSAPPEVSPNFFSLDINQTENQLFTDNWVDYVTSSFQLIGTSFVLIGLFLIANHDKRFAPFSIIGNLLMLTNAILLGLWFEALATIVILIIYIGEWVYWEIRDKKGVHEERLTINEIVFSLLIVFSLSSLGSILAFVEVEGHPLGHKFLGMKKYSDIILLDSIQTAFKFLAVWYIAKRKVEGQLLLIIGNVIGLVMYLFIDKWVMVGSKSTYILLASATWIGWEAKFAIDHSKVSFLYFWKVKEPHEVNHGV